ncbi:MAG TPA: hypothetical protein DCE41_24730 [Cytophagales bacterium]|nr:hypothetical protein [Cytophagales bacterium]
MSATIAQKYFGDQPPLGALLEVEGKGVLEVTGVLAEPMAPSHLSLDFLVHNGAMGYTSRLLTDEETHAFSYYLKVPDESLPLVAQTLEAVSNSHLNQEGGARVSLSLQPLTEVYFGEPLVFDLARHNRWSLIQTLVVIGLILLLVVSVNLVNLTIAKLSKRVKQIGVKKILGSTQRMLIRDWATEVYVMVLMATLLGFGGGYLLLPFLLKVYPINLAFPNGTTMAVAVVGLPLLITGLIILLPGIVFSSLSSFAALKGKLGTLKTNAIQHSLLSFQLVVASVLIVLTLVIFQQFEYLQNKEIGLDEEHVLVFNSNNKHSWKNKDFIREEVQALAGVEAVSLIYGGIPESPTEAFSYGLENATYQWNTAFVEPNLIPLLDLKVVDGQAFDERIAPQNQSGILLNESAARAMGWPQTEVVGRALDFAEEDVAKPIVGVVQDYHYESFKQEIEPLVLHATGWEETFVVKLAGQDYATAVAEIEGIWNTYVPRYPFAYHFLEDSFLQMHAADTRNRSIIYLFTLLTILIATMGTLSLGAIVQQSKVKEVTIRKILGAPLHHIFYTLSASFVKVMLLSSLIAVPGAWWLSTYWLSEFSYRIALSPGLFVLGFGLLITFVLALIVTQAWKTATLNPAHRLKAE